MISILAYFFIKNLGKIVRLFSKELGQIFMSLSKAEIIPAFQFPLVFLLLYFLVIKKHKGRVALAIFFIVFAFVNAVLFASVNSVVFKDVLISLISMVKQGVINEL